MTPSRARPLAPSTEATMLRAIDGPLHEPPQWRHDVLADEQVVDEELEHRVRNEGGEDAAEERTQKNPDRCAGVIAERGRGLYAVRVDNDADPGGSAVWVGADALAEADSERRLC